jgi:hypothetical protein
LTELVDIGPWAIAAAGDEQRRGEAAGRARTAVTCAWWRQASTHPAVVTRAIAMKPGAMPINSYRTLAAQNAA